MERAKKRASAGDGRDRVKKPLKPSKPVFDRTLQPPPGLVAKNPPPQPKLKHTAYFELVDNTNKKALDFQITRNKEPPPGFTFVPIGNLELIALCKDLSREKGAMIFMVSTSKDVTNPLAAQMTRIGHHIRESIVEEARNILGYPHTIHDHTKEALPEPIPETQEEINAQADAALRELFPRIPNTDRQEIIDHAFRKGATFHGEPVVGLSTNIPLSRRVQLAVLAHIRHRHTRYDQLLKETTWQHARKTVEEVCLVTVVKWRGDEENGRDKLDSILREVVIISDSEDDDDESEDSDDLVIISPRTATSGSVTAGLAASSAPSTLPLSSGVSEQTRNVPPADAKLAAPRKTPTTPNRAKGKRARLTKRDRKAAKKAQRGFRRYQAAWDQAVDRIRHEEQTGHSSHDASMARSTSNGGVPSGPFDFKAAQPAYPVLPPRTEDSYARPSWPHELTHPDQERTGGFRVMPRTDMAVQEVRYGEYPTHSRLPVERPRAIPRSYTGPVLPVQMNPASQSQDLPVPSIEPPSPRPSGPQFVRSLPPRKHHRDESPEFYPIYRIPESQTYRVLRSPEIVQDEHAKRRRLMGDRDDLAGRPSNISRSVQPAGTPPDTQRGPTGYRSSLYPVLDPPSPFSHPPPRQEYYEARPERAELQRVPSMAHQSHGAAPEIIEIRRAVQEPPRYDERRYLEPVRNGEPRVFREPPLPLTQTGRSVIESQPPLYTERPYRLVASDPRPAAEPSSEPIFVRRVEPRIDEVRPRHVHDERREVIPKDNMLPVAVGDRYANRPDYAPSRRVAEPYREEILYPALPVRQHYSTADPAYHQEPMVMEGHRQRLPPRPLLHPVPPSRNIIVID